MLNETTTKEQKKNLFYYKSYVITFLFVNNQFLGLNTLALSLKYQPVFTSDRANVNDALITNGRFISK